MAVNVNALTESGIWDKIADTACETAWVVCGFSDPTTVVIQATGSGNLDELMAALKDDEVQFAGMRVTAIDRKGSRTR